MTPLTPTIRAARPDDLDAVAAIWHAGWTEVHLDQVPASLAARRGRQDLRRDAADRLGQACVAEAGRDVVGFVMVHADEVEHLYVAPGARGSGAAALLLAHAEAAIAATCPRAWLAVVAANRRACRFYERSGWACRGEFAHAARVDGETIVVPTLRYEKTFDGAPRLDRRP